IRLRGQDVTGWPYQRRRAAGVAYMAAGRLEEGLVADLTLSEHLALAQPEPAFFVDRTRARQQMAERIEKYAIQGRPETVAAALSGGNQQRLLFALLGEPLALLLEDPTRGLDLRSTNAIWELLYARLADGATILFTSADLEEIIERSDRIAVFSAGRMSRILLAGETSLDELGHLIGGEA
ncbi:MAG: ABC transporter ATP-binding protein, partial [Candidatus Promineifilaceae bacterium]